jgi:dehydrogenase/reductase SDR family protein 4
VGSKEQRLKLIDETVKKYGGIDFLIPNAAISTHMGNFFEANEGQISKMWDINYKSVFLLVQEALPHLRKRPNSNIVILASYVACKFFANER